MAIPDDQSGDYWGGRAAYRRGRRFRCSGCGMVPTSPIERAEVAMTWLLPAGRAGRGSGTAGRATSGAGLSEGFSSVIEQHFCRGCVPAGPVADMACVRCGDGPLLGGDLAGGDAVATAIVRAWLTGVGWHPLSAQSGPVCPECVGELSR